MKACSYTSKQGHGVNNNILHTMREKQRYQVYKWTHAPKVSFNEFESLIQKDLQNQLGDFGLAAAGPRFRLFPIGTKGFVVKVRIEAHVNVMRALKEIKGIRLIHVAGSARLAQRAIVKKLDGVLPIDTLSIW